MFKAELQIPLNDHGTFRRAGAFFYWSISIAFSIISSFVKSDQSKAASTSGGTPVSA
jgi:hypothetical protein